MEGCASHRKQTALSSTILRPVWHLLCQQCKYTNYTFHRPLILPLFLYDGSFNQCLYYMSRWMWKQSFVCKPSDFHNCVARHWHIVEWLTLPRSCTKQAQCSIWTWIAQQFNGTRRRVTYTAEHSAVCISLCVPSNCCAIQFQACIPIHPVFNLTNALVIRPQWRTSLKYPNTN